MKNLFTSKQRRTLLGTTAVLACCIIIQACILVGLVRANEAQKSKLNSERITNEYQQIK
ncbi:MAG: hypothetical protein JXQ87_04340 [Bacteroidia bacterium]